MKPIREAVDLQWTRIKWWKREFELRSGDEVLAKLYSQKGTRNVIGEAADGQWVFKRRSFWNAEIVITESASQAEIAVAKSGRANSVTFSDGRLFTLKKPSFWRDEWIWFNEEGAQLLHFQRSKSLQLEPAALSLPELSLLVILGWHLIMLQQESDAAVSAAVTASV